MKGKKTIGDEEEESHVVEIEPASEQTIGSTSRTVEDGAIVNDVAASLKEKMKAMEQKGLEEEKRGLEEELPTISRVAQDVRRGDNTHAYDPKMISIGPYHRDKPELRPMDDVKLLLLKRLLARDQKNQLSYYTDEIQRQEAEARRHYEDRCDGLDSKEFVEMMVLDGSFLVELLLEYAEHEEEMSLNGRQRRKMATLREDLMLLENQIPFLVLQIIHGGTTYKESSGKSSILDLALHYLCKKKKRTEVLPGGQRNVQGIKHLLHLSYLGLKVGLEQTHDAAATTATWSVWLRFIPSVAFLIVIYSFFIFYEFLFMSIKPKRYNSRRDDVPDHPMMVPTATQLWEAGVQLKKKHGRMLGRDVSFRDGVLEIIPTIPLVRIDGNTNSRFRNLLAFEQCCPAVGRGFMSYLVLMDNLIHTAQDVATLKRGGILGSALGCDEDVAKFFNGIRAGTYFKFDDDHDLLGVFRAVNDYCNKDYNRWRAKLAQDYFGNPWSVLTLLAAVAALTMTAVQTYYTV